MGQGLTSLLDRQGSTGPAGDEPEECGERKVFPSGLSGMETGRLSCPGCGDGLVMTWD